MTPSPEALVEFWFADAATSEAACSRRLEVWFGEDPAFDEALRSRFGDLPDRAAAGELDAWRAAPRTALALVLAVDQLPRNLYRATPRAFAYDAVAQRAAVGAVAAGHDRAIHPIEATFLYLPFEHAEDLAMQERSVELYEALRARITDAASVVAADAGVDYARRHRDTVRRFGRFPHRNAILGRASTPEEAKFLAAGGESFSATRHPVANLTSVPPMNPAKRP